MLYCKNFVNDLAEKIIEKNCECCIKLDKLCYKNKQKQNFQYIDEGVRDMILRNSYDFTFKGDEDLMMSIALCYWHESKMNEFFVAMEILECHNMENNNKLSDGREEENQNNLIRKFCYMLKEHENCVGDSDWKIKQTKEMHHGLAFYQVVPCNIKEEGKEGNKNGVKDLSLKEWLEVLYSGYAPELRNGIQVENPWMFDDFEENYEIPNPLLQNDNLNILNINPLHQLNEVFREVNFDDGPGNFRQNPEFFFEHNQS